MRVNNKIIKSIIGSITLKLSSAAISFISVPLLLKALGTNNYAIWVTITALMAWLNLFDFGSGYSLKNKVTELNAKDESNKLGVLIAGTLQLYIFMSIVMIIIFIISTYYVDIFKSHLYLASIIYVPIILSFPFTLGHFIIQGLKKFNLFNLILFGQNILWLIIILSCKYKLFTLNIFELAYNYSLLYIISNLTIILYSLNKLNFKWIQVFNLKNFISSTTSLLIGTKFFILQVSSLFLYSIGNILTYNNLTLKNVAEYDIINKIFLMGITIFNVVISVFWVEVSHAKALNDKIKLSKIYNQLLLCAFTFSIGTCIIVFFTPTIIAFWTNKAIVISSIKDVYPFALLIIIQMFAYCGAVFLNAFEELKGQIWFSIFASIFMIPLSKFLFTSSFGIGSVPLSSAILTFPTLIYVLYKSKIIIHKI